MMQFKTLQQRLIFFLLVPVVLLLLGFGSLGFFYARQTILKEWQEAAILRLERAAHQLDMRLSWPEQWMQGLVGIKQGAQEEMQKWLLDRIRALPGVKQVQLTWKEGPAPQPVAAVSECRFTFEKGQEAVTLTADLLDSARQPLGQLQISIRFAYLMEGILTSGWLQSYMACLVDETGHYLAHTDPGMQGRIHLGETHDRLEAQTLATIKAKHSGTIMGPGHPPEQVIGFYRLHQAPWVILVYAHGHQILEPMVRFRYYYLVAGGACIAIILLLIRLGVNPMVSSIRRLSQAAGRLAQGDYGEPLPVERRDEIGQLIQSFNAMVTGLKERDFISNTFGRYVDPEVAAELLRRPEAALLGGEKRPVALIFGDIRGFTPIAETLSPEATIHLLNRYFSNMIEVIRRHRGIIVDFIGDAILVFFDPLEHTLDVAVRRALECSLEMQAQMAAVNAPSPGHGLPTIEMGIGLHAGEVVVGNIGSETRAKYGIVGSAVNLTHRIQSEAHGGEVVLSDAAFAQLSPAPAVKRKFQAHLKGVQQPLTLYVVAGSGEV
jgi:class 3 adenylate cyclase